MEIKGAELLRGLRGIARAMHGDLRNRDAYIAGLYEVSPELLAAKVYADLLASAQKGAEHVAVYTCSKPELDKVNEELGANWSGSLNWIFTDENRDIRRILAGSLFGRALAFCEEAGLRPSVHAVGRSTRLIRIEICVDWSEDALAKAA